MAGVEPSSPEPEGAPDALNKNKTDTLRCDEQLENVPAKIHSRPDARAAFGMVHG
jgi:hypothetical protein